VKSGDNTHFSSDFVRCQSRARAWPLLMTLAMDRLQILDDVSNLIQTRMRDRLRLTTTGRFPTIIRLERLRAPIDRRWLASN
jgi:hypothetical protein